MPSFKVTVIISDGLTLGHVLMTKGVDLEHIVEMPDAIMQHRRSDPIMLEKPIRKKKTIFHHPSGKTLKEFVIEYLTDAPSKTAKWREINVYLSDLGYGKSTLNNGLKRLIEDNKVVRIKTGLFKLVEKKG